MSIMLWLDVTKRPLDQRLLEAAEHYTKKYGAAPDRAQVNPVVLAAYTDQPSVVINGVLVSTHKSILPQDIHVWRNQEEVAA
jgi:hypothetical protein